MAQTVIRVCSSLTQTVPISAIAIGCGGLGGGGDTTSMCGDASPIGGHFGGFFFGTVFTPDINDAGDVLFLCDVNGGDSRRALFLYQAASGQIVKVAAVGDPSPIGGTFGAVGPGSINNEGKVVFLASPVGDTINSNLFMWDNGVVTKVAALGDPAPGGGTFSGLGTESFGFQDGTSIPVGPVPDINDSDQIAFRAIVTGGITGRGIVVRTNQVDEWYVKVPDPTPIGGTYLDMQAAAINNAGQIAFFADYDPSPNTTNSGWFAGAPGNWRKVVVFFDPIDGGECLGLAFSRNPMQTIDAAGNVVFWANLDSNNPADRLVVGLTDGNLLIAARSRRSHTDRRHVWVNGCLACHKRQHRHAQRRDAWRPKRRAQRAHGFQSLPKWDTYSEPHSDTYSYAEYDANTDGDVNAQPDRYAEHPPKADSNT